VVSLGDEVDVMVLDIDEERRRISLGIKQCKGNPWEEFAEKNAKGEKVSGKIKSITDFGIFIGLDGGIDGLVHLSDISWDLPGEEAVRSYKKGDEIETVILSVDSERERISLGVKQLSRDPFAEYVDNHEKGNIVKGTVKEVDAKGAIIEVMDGVEAILKGSDISRDPVEDATQFLKVGDEIEAKLTVVDRKNRNLILSIKAKDQADDKKVMDEMRKQEEGPKTIGDLIKAQMDK
jgi:small subunit ribosomal protein S1